MPSQRGQHPSGDLSQVPEANGPRYRSLRDDQLVPAQSPGGRRTRSRRREDDRARRLCSLRTAWRRAGSRQALAPLGTRASCPRRRAGSPPSQGKGALPPREKEPSLPGRKMHSLPGLRHNPPGTPQRRARSSVDRASVSGTEGQGFESLRARHFQPVHTGHMVYVLYRRHS